MTQDDRIQAIEAQIECPGCLGAGCDECGGSGMVPRCPDCGRHLDQLTALRSEFEAYKAEHHDCVQQALDESVAVHDQIEARRDGIESQLTALVQGIEAQQKQWREQAFDLAKRDAGGNRATQDYLATRTGTFHECADCLDVFLIDLRSRGGTR